jgi:hypothetical protein
VVKLRTACENTENSPRVFETTEIWASFRCSVAIGESESSARDLFRGALEMMVLRTLQQQPLHGYALVQHIKRSSRDLLQVEEGSCGYD